MKGSPARGVRCPPPQAAARAAQLQVLHSFTASALQGFMKTALVRCFYRTDSQDPEQPHSELAIAVDAEHL